MSSLEFARAARQISQAARMARYEVPAFRSPPKVPRCRRSLKRRTDGSITVSIQIKGRPFAAIVADMVEGVLAANELTRADADRLADMLWEAATELIVSNAELRQHPPQSSSQRRAAA